jgi:hypothetical protein
MLLAVAGLKPDEIKKRTQDLASGNWSAFPPAERLAFHFGHKLSTRPAALADRDVRELVETFGRERALDLIWYGSWCNYMTRVADAFQLPLERENAFAPRTKAPDNRSKSR